MGKWQSILRSSRFELALLNLVILFANDLLKLNLSTETLVLITTTILGWIIGRTIRPGGTMNNGNAKAGITEDPGGPVP